VSRIEQLKEEYRSFEQDEQWEKALDFYSQAIDQTSAEDTPDIALFNRAGDLATKVENAAQAVAFYERAVDFYMDAGLPNNAIAVCKKVMRNLPDRHSIHLKMGQIRARQGFITDARTSFVTYAERVQAAGGLDEALRALIEFVNLAPDDYEMGMMRADQLEQNNRPDDAIAQYVGAYRSMQRQGLGDLAASVAAKVRKLKPDLAVDVDAAAADPLFGRMASVGAEGEDSKDSAKPVAEEPEVIGPVDLPLMSFDDDGEAAAEQAAAKLAEEPAAPAVAESPGVPNGDPKSGAPTESSEGYVDIGAVLIGEGGQTFLQKVQPEAALRSLERGLAAPCDVEEERVGKSTTTSGWRMRRWATRTLRWAFTTGFSRSTSTLRMSRSVFGPSAPNPRDPRTMPMLNPMTL
jgi:tetratricopeptide (TPR) repeat protein